MNDLQNRESFSFSTSSKVGLLSGDEDGGVGDHHHARRRISDHHKKDYLEISLPPPPLLSELITKTNQNEEKEEEFEFCFSFNSSSTLLDLPTTPIATSNHPFNDHESPMSTSGTCTTFQVIDVAHKKYNHDNKSKNSIHYKRIFQRVTSPRCHQGLHSPYVFGAPVEDQGATRSRRFKKNLPKLTNRNSARFGGIRKFMVKLRSIKSMLVSSLNFPRRLQPSPIDKFDKKTKNTFTGHKLNKKDLQRNCGLMTIKNGVNNKFVTDTHNLNQSKEKIKSCRMMKFDGLSKMMDVIMKNIRITRTSKQMGSKSCPISAKSSPMHDTFADNTRDERRKSFYSRDHSIQAAIAHYVSVADLLVVRRKASKPV